MTSFILLLVSSLHEPIEIFYFHDCMRKINRKIRQVRIEKVEIIYDLRKLMVLKLMVFLCSIYSKLSFCYNKLIINSLIRQPDTY